MPYLLVTATEQANIIQNLTSYADIRTAMGINWQGSAAWAGPGPRVTRSRIAGTPNKQTLVAWVLDVNDAAVQRYGGIEPVKTEVKRAVRQALTQVDTDTWKVVNVTDYNPDMNGAISWWQDGRAGASITHTRDNTPDLLGLTREENPVGPDDARLRPASLADLFDPESGLRKQAEDLAKTIKFVGYMILAAIGVYAVIKLAPAINTVVQKALGRKTNPRRSLTARRHTPKGLPAPGYYYGGWTP